MLVPFDLKSLPVKFGTVTDMGTGVFLGIIHAPEPSGQGHNAAKFLGPPIEAHPFDLKGPKFSTVVNSHVFTVKHAPQCKGCRHWCPKFLFTPTYAWML